MIGLGAVPVDPSAERYVLSFTVRDSPVDFINVSCWGGQHFITDLADKLGIGQIGHCYTWSSFMDIAGLQP